MAKSTPQARFWKKVNRNGPIPGHVPHLGPCWLWMAGVNTSGYGWFGYNGARTAHGLAYEWLVGTVPHGLQLDHLCRVRHCVNPAHLEPVTQRENIMRGESFGAANARKTHCAQGHEFSPENTYIRVNGGRRCRKCQRGWNANQRS
jgi:hypothetical protein